MGKRSTKTDKNIYQTSRENMELTREKASELMECISASRIEKIESEKSLPHPEEILMMSKCYKNPGLCNYFCSHECPIGQEYVPEVQPKDLSQIALELLATLNSIDKDKNRIIEIAADGQLTSDEYEDFVLIKEKLDKIALTIDTLSLWLQNTVAEGSVDASVLHND